MKIKHTIFATVILLCLYAPGLHAQLGWQWGTGSHSIGIEFSDMAADPFGNVYNVGQGLGGVATFGPFTVVDSFSTGQQGVIVSVDSDGNYRWAMATQHEGAYFSNVATDPYGNIYVTGTENPGDGTVIGGKSCGAAPFCVKIDTAGNVKWIYTIGDNTDTYIDAITVSKTGFIYIAGTFTGFSLTIGGTVLTNSGPYGTNDVFYAKFDSSFHPVWAKSFGSITGARVTAACVTDDSFIYLGGIYTSVIYLGPDSLTQCGSLPYYVAKFNPSGDPVWARQIDGRSYFTTQLNSIATDKNDNVYIAGCYDTTFVFGADTLQPLSDAGMFLAKYDSAGSPKWATALPAMHISYKVAADACGNLWTCGGAGIPISIGNDTMIAAEYDTSGILENTIVLSIGGDDINGLALDNNGNVYLGSDYMGSAAITGHILPYTPIESLFTAKCKYEIGGCIRDTLFVLHTGQPAKLEPGQVKLFPNPASEQCTISNPQGFPDGAILEINDVSGKPLKKLPVSGYEYTIPLDGFPSGLYIYHLYAPGGGYVTGKLVILK